MSKKSLKYLHKFNTKSSAKLNRSLVLGIIKNHSFISRAEIAKLTNMSPATVTYILNDFLEKGLVKEVSQGESTSVGGRKPILLQINGSNSFIIGIEINLTKIVAIISDLEGSIINKYSFPLIDKSDPLSDLKKAISKVLSKHKDKKDKILGIGISAPGIINSDEGIIIYNEYFKWKNIPIAKPLFEEFNIPIYIENDANAAALGELYFNQQLNSDTLIYILIHESLDEKYKYNLIGIGCGIVIDNEIFHGINWQAGEIHQSINFMLENLLKKKPFNSFYKEVEGSITFSKLLDLAKKNNEIAVRIQNLIAKEVGRIIANAVDLFDPGAVIIGGCVYTIDKNFHNELIESFNKNHASTHSDVKILYSEFGKDSVLMGALAIVFNEIFISMKTKHSLLFT